MMDSGQQLEVMKYLGFFAICTESFKLISTWRKVFFHITLALILPYALIYLTYQQVSDFIISKILGDAINLEDIPYGTTYEELSRRLNSAWMTYYFIKILYFTFLLLFSLLTTSAVTYTVASVYAHRNIAFKKVMSVVPKVWKRVSITFLATFFVFLLYNVMYVMMVLLWFFIWPSTRAIPAIFIGSILYFLACLFMSVVWQLSSVVSVLENYRGLNAMRKSQELVRGKFWLSFFVLIFPSIFMLAIEFGFLFLVVRLDVLGWAGRILLAILFVALILYVILYSLVITTVTYFVVKSYHNEVVDIPSLASHLGEYEQLGDQKEIQMGDSSV